MDCRTAHAKIEEKADGFLPQDADGELSRHLSGCSAWAAEDAAASATGPLLRALAGIRAKEKAPALDAMWTRVRTGIEEGREARMPPSGVANPVSVEVGAVYASNEGRSMDPALGIIRGKLQSMFNYTSYRMLDRKRRALAIGETAGVAG